MDGLRHFSRCSRQQGIVLLLCLFVLILSAGASCVRAGTVLFTDDFQQYRPGGSPTPLWNLDSGTWKVTAEGLEGSDCEGFFTAVGAATGREQWSDYTLSLELKVVSRGSDWRDGPWIGVRSRDTLNAYTVSFYTRNTALHKIAGGKSTGDTNALAESPTTIKDDAWHAISITVKGAHISVTLDGKPLLQATDNNWNDTPPVASGGITLSARKYEAGTGHTTVIFRKVRVEAVGEVSDAMKWTMADARKTATRSVDLLQFLQQRKNRRYTAVPRKVLAFYYTWYGNPQHHDAWRHWSDVDPAKHETASSEHYPAKGAYDSYDPAILDYHCSLAKSCGIDGFISTWWGQGGYEDGAFPLLLDVAQKHGLQATIYWETAPGKGIAQIDQAISDLTYVLKKYGSHPAFLRYDGKPVIFVYGRVMGQVPMNSWPAIIEGAEKTYGKDFLLIADGYSTSNARIFDGVHTYNICGWVQKKTPDELHQLSRETFAKSVAVARQQGKISCITVIPGYDDTKIRKPGLNAARQDGATYKALWEEAIKADPDWILITTWNEWHEGSEIEPSYEYGDKYIKLTGEYAPKFQQLPPCTTTVPTEASLAAGKMHELQQLFQGKTIAVLPDFSSSIVLWIADAGLQVKQLSWDDVLDPARLNVQNYPVLIYGSGENYVRSWNKTGDVDDALLRYLHQGGFLIAASSLPFPFYYDDQGNSVVAAAKFGLPVGGSGAFDRADVAANANVKGWETPPDAADLAFKVDTQLLPGLAATAPFPTSGDQRWRPCAKAGIAADDVYLPLVRLTDAAGTYYGDGVAYIEHKSSEPRGGKDLYVWMRMPDALGANDFYYSLLRFVAGKMTR